MKKSTRPNSLTAVQSLAVEPVHTRQRQSNPCGLTASSCNISKSTRHGCVLERLIKYKQETHGLEQRTPMSASELVYTVVIKALP